MVSYCDLSLEELMFGRGPGWPGRWRNELSPDQRCWTADKVRVHLMRRARSSGRATRSAPPCPCPARPCPSMGSLRGWGAGSSEPARQKMVTVGRTLDDLPMQHTQEDAFGLLERRRAELAAQRRNMRQESGEIKTVSNFSRRMFDSAMSSRGQAPPPAPSAREEAALFFRPARPSWSSQQSQDSTRLKLRPHSMTAAESSVPVRPVVSKTRPDSEPPTSSHRGREFNHLRYHRKMYPHINTLVQRYNEDMRVVCNQTPEICENRRNSRDFSVASEFLLVPLRQDEPVDEQEEEAVEEPLAGSRESDLAVQQEHKTEDQLPGEMMRPETKSFAAGSALSEPDKEDGAPSVEGSVEEEPSPPWRCWVDDATVSTVHSHAASEADLEEHGELAEEGGPRRSSTMRTGTLADEAADQSDAAKAHRQGHQAEQLVEEPAQAKSPVSAKTVLGPKDKKGKKKKEEALPEPPPPPVEEPPIVVEEVVEVEELEPEPEPEPVPPTYICPSSESKSHNAEIRRWLGKSPFRTATKTMPIF